VAATLKTRSDRADDDVIPKSSSSSIQIGETTYVFTKPQNRVVQSMGRGPQVARELTFCGPQKALDFQASIADFEKYCQDRV